MKGERHTIPPETRPLSIKPVIQVKWRSNPELTLHVMRMYRLGTRYTLIAQWLNTHYSVDFFTKGKIAGVVYRQRIRS